MLFVHLLSRLPLAVLQVLARPLYAMLFYLLRYRRVVVADNLYHAFPEADTRTRRALERGFYRHLARLLLEVIAARRLPSAAYARRVQLDNPELLRARLAHGGPLVVLTIHQGNWEWMLHAVSLQLGVRIDPVYKPLHHAGWDRFAFAVRSRFGNRPLPMEQAARDILREREAQRLFVLLADQAAPRHQAYWTTFMHRDAGFYRGAARIAAALDVPVLFAQNRCLGPGRYAVRFHLLSDTPRALGTEALIERYVRLAEQCIREQPQTYLWSNRRWRRQRPAGHEHEGQTAVEAVR